MAEILEGKSDLSTTAPLSKAQTIQIVRHVQSEVREVENEVDETNRKLQHAVDHIEKLRDQQRATHDDVHTLQVGLNNTNLNVGKLENQVGRLLEAVSRLQHGFENSRDHITQLQEGKRMTDTRLDAMTNEITQNKQNAVMLQQVLETKVKDHMRLLGKTLENFQLGMDQAKAERVLLAEAEKKNSDSVKQAHATIEGLMAEVKKANTVTNIIETRLACTAKTVQSNFGKVEEVTKNVVKLQDSHAMLKDRVGDAESFVKQVFNTAQLNNENIEENMRHIERNTDKLAQVQKMVEEGYDEREEMRHDINALRQSQEKSSRLLGNLERDLKDVGQMASAVKAGLKEQSSILLPNIQVHDEAQIASERHGSLLVTAPTSGRRPKSTNAPRKLGRTL